MASSDDDLGAVSAHNAARDIKKAKRQRPVYGQGEDKERTADATWYRGKHTNFIASQANLEEPNALEDYVLKGWLPERPFISRADTITAFGSCFASYLTKYLRELRYSIGGDDGGDTHVLTHGAGMVNTYALRQQLEWAYDEAEFTEDLWHDRFGRKAKRSDKIKENTRAVFDRSDVFIFTLGLSEVWYSKVTGNVFWRTIPSTEFDDEKHGFRVTTVEENCHNLERIYSIIRKHRPDAAIVFTISPVPLVATFRPVSCITANSVSKAILRVSVDETMRKHESDPKLFYWPSYEIVKDYIREPYKPDNRHIKPEVVARIMEEFSKYYLSD